MKFNWKALLKKKAFWAGVVAIVGAAGIVLPPGTTDALLILFGS
jgi:hypothetical protein